MRALISAAITADATRDIGVRLGWELVRVTGVGAEVAAMSSDERKHVVALMVEAEPVGAEIVASLPALELIVCLRSDPVNVDVDAATRVGVPVMFSPGRNAESVADFTLALLLDQLRGVARAHHDIVSGALTVDPTADTQSGGDVIWVSPDLPVNPYEVYKGPELSSMAVAVVGFGYVGRAVAHRLSGLVRKIYVVDPTADARQVSAASFELVDLATALACADVVSLHARSPSVIIGVHEFARMRPGSYLINTARATVLDYTALAVALRSGKLRGAALDVYPEEPLRSSSPLLRLPNLTLTPHLAGASTQVVERQSANLTRTMRTLYGAEQAYADLPVANPSVLASWGAERATRSGNRGGS